MARLTKSTEIPVLYGLNCDSWGEFVEDCAQEAGVPFASAWALFELFGESEAQDGFLSALQDLAFENAEVA